MLNELQNLLAEIYDVPLPHDVAEFLLTDRDALPQAARDSGTDEQVLVAEDDDTLWVHVYLEPALLARLESANPFAALNGGNIADYWTALEGVSHFLYLAWNASHDRAVTLMELELQAEIDKYVSTLWLLREQNPRRFPAELHHLLFERAHVDATLAGVSTAAPIITPRVTAGDSRAPCCRLPPAQRPTPVPNCAASTASPANAKSAISSASPPRPPRGV